MYLGSITLIQTYYTIYLNIGRWGGVEGGVAYWMMYSIHHPMLATVRLPQQ